MTRSLVDRLILAAFPHDHVTPEQRTAIERVVREDRYQRDVHEWMLACFGPEITEDKVERVHRFLEEALELAQAIGGTAKDAHRLVQYVFGRPVGEPVQEAGGVLVTLAALCQAAGVDMAAAGERELDRVWTKIDVIREKQRTKPHGSPLPEEPGLREQVEATIEDILAEEAARPPVARAPVPMLLFCPVCTEQHVDGPQPEIGWDNPPHRSHLCGACGHVWRPADAPTTGVQVLDTAGSRDGSPRPASFRQAKGRNSWLEAALTVTRFKLEEALRVIVNVNPKPGKAVDCGGYTFPALPFADVGLPCATCGKLQDEHGDPGPHKVVTEPGS